MTATRYDLMTGRKDKDGKTRWLKCGVMFPAKNGRDGFTIKLESYPLPDETGAVWINCMVPREDDNSPARQSSKPTRDTRGFEPDETEVPF